MAAGVPVYWWIRGNGAPALDTVVASETPVAADAE
jgi:hypothetical protein